MNLPERILAHTGRILSIVRPAQGENSDVTMLQGEHGEFALKQATNEKQVQTVAAEYRVLRAIGDAYPFVPKALAAGPDFLLMTRLPGRDLVAAQPDLTPTDLHRLMAEAAEALHRIHRWRPDLPPPPERLFTALQEAGVEPDIVFTHNDYCLPNIMIDGGHVSAIIDWPHAMYSDRRVDLAAAARSIRRNLKEESYVETFLQAYGYTGDLEVFARIGELF